MAEPRPVKGVILVGAPKLDTRFRPLSLNCPKPLFPIAGRPLVYHQIAACAKIPGMQEVILIGQYADSEFADFVAATSRELNVTVRYLREYTSLGTAGGLYHFRDQITRGSPAWFFVLHVDVCSDFPLSELIEFQAARADAATSHTIMSVKARNDQAHFYGCLISDEQNRVQHFVEKPKSFVSNYINCGVYLFTAGIFDNIRDVFLRNHDRGVHGSEEIWIEKDIIPGLIGAQSLFILQTDVFWSQIKTAAAALYANRHYLSTYAKKAPELLATDGDGHPTIVGDVIIHESADIDSSAKIGPNVSIGPGVRVKAGARIRDAIVLSNVSLDEHSVILNSIVGWNSHVGPWGRIEGENVGVNPNDPSTPVATKPLFSGGKLVASITIIGDGVDVASEVIVKNSIVLPHKQMGQSTHNEIVL